MWYILTGIGTYSAVTESIVTDAESSMTSSCLIIIYLLCILGSGMVLGIIGLLVGIAGEKKGLIIGAVVGVVLGAALGTVGVSLHYLYGRVRKKRGRSSSIESSHLIIN